MSDTFNTYGYSFQIKLLASLFKNKIFLQQISDILDSNYFEKSLASYAQLVYRPNQGIHLIAKYDYFDPVYDLNTGAISRYSYGCEIYPLNMLEIKLQMRDYKVDNLDLEFDNEYLVQVHTWF